MFESKGTVTEEMLQEVYRSFMPKWYPLAQAIPMIILFGLAVLATLRHQILQMGIYLIFAMLIYTIMRNRNRKNAARDLNQMRKASGREEIVYITDFEEERISVKMEGTEIQTEIPYESLGRIIETKELFVLLTAKKESIFVFKENLTSEERSELLDFLKSKNSCIKL